PTAPVTYILSLHDALPISDIDGSVFRFDEHFAHDSAQRVAAGSRTMIAQENPRHLGRAGAGDDVAGGSVGVHRLRVDRDAARQRDRKSTRLNSSHDQISYA